MPESKPIVGYLTLTQQGEAKFERGTDYPSSYLCREILSCGHTYVTPTFAGKVQPAKGRQCKFCAAGDPPHISQERILAWLQGEEAGRSRWIVTFDEEGEPDIEGPFATDAKRVEWAQRYWRKAQGTQPMRLDVYTSGIPLVDIFTPTELGTPDTDQVGIL